GAIKKNATRCKTRTKFQSRAFLSRGEPMNARITVYRQRTNSTYRRSVTWFVRNTKQPLRNILSPASESFERLASAPRRDPRRRLSAHARSRTAAAPECRPVGPLSGTPSPLRSVRRPRRDNRGGHRPPKACIFDRALPPFGHGARIAYGQRKGDFRRGRLSWPKS